MQKQTKRLITRELIGFMDELMYGAAEFVEDAVNDVVGAEPRSRRSSRRGPNRR